MAVLSRTYRPQRFADVAGQEHVKTTLAREAATGALAHSYLFTGPRGVGKTTVARIFARAVNCADRAKGTGEPCGACDSCRETAEGRALDVIEIDAASHTGVDNVREQVIENARFAPTRSAFKVFIIDEVHMLSASAFNALLKTLEEPPKHAMFILATTELHKLPATVVSRCQRFDFRKIGREDLLARLKTLAKAEGVETDDDVLETVARQSEGCLRDAESLLTQLFSLGGKRVTAETAALVLPAVSSEAVHGLAAAIVERNAGAALKALEGLTRGGADPARLLSETTEIVRSAALARLREEPYAPPFAADDAWRARLEGMRRALAPVQAAALLMRLTAARDEMKRAETPELPLELMIMETAGEEDAKPRTQRPLQPPLSGEGPKKPEAGVSEKPPLKEGAGGVLATEASLSLSDVKNAWMDVLRKAQEKNHGLPYMLGAAELLSCEEGALTIGFQYAMYRDRLNEVRHRQALELALQEVMGAAVVVKTVLVAQKTDGTVEPAPAVRVEKAAGLPDGFAELVKEFGGIVAP